jgi:hemoglobin-like flavoprotein
VRITEAKIIDLSSQNTSSKHMWLRLEINELESSESEHRLLPRIKTMLGPSMEVLLIPPWPQRANRLAKILHRSEECVYTYTGRYT